MPFRSFTSVFPYSFFKQFGRFTGKIFNLCESGMFTPFAYCRECPDKTTKQTNKNTNLPTQTANTAVKRIHFMAENVFALVLEEVVFFYFR